MIIHVVLILLAAGTSVDVPVPKSRNFFLDWSHKYFAHTLWDQALEAHVDSNGLVDYAGMKRDARYREYLHRLAHTDAVELTSPDAREAFWINAYNALAIHGAISIMPDKPAERADFSVRSYTLGGYDAGQSFTHGLRFNVGQRWWTLDEIENRILFRRWDDLSPAERDYYEARAPAHRDPRVHLALVRCARGSPELWREAFAPEKIDEQLDGVTRTFFNDSTRSHFTAATHTWYVARIMDGGAADFTDPGCQPHAPSLVDFATRYVDDPELQTSLKTEPWRILFMDFDGRLNIQTPTGASP